MHNLLYGDDATIDDRILFRDLDIDDPISKKDATGDCKILFSERYTFADDLRATLAICDKLAMRYAVDEILTLDKMSDVTYGSLIINHALSNDALIKLYAHAKTRAYNLLHGCIHYDTEDATSESDHDIFRNATLNGMHVTNISVNDKFMNDDHVRYCISLTKLNIDDKDCKITTCAPFAKSLRVLHIPSDCKISNKGIGLCTSIVELNAHENRKITTCNPFADSLEALDASGCCGIGDRGLALCRSIKKLDACNNCKITTCKPFANTLKILNAENNCGITDIGIATCYYIEHLYASNNYGITTCEPFANTLKILNAGNNCGITDIGIATCYYIKELYASNNYGITTCKPFAKSLKLLGAAKECGINDDGIAACHSLEYLEACCNPMITTCAPFAKSLKYLYASGNESGMDTKGARLCKSLIMHYTMGNDKIDRSKITAKYQM